MTLSSAQKLNDHHVPAGPESNPSLAFCRGTGAAHQFFGLILVLGTCCWGFVYVFLEDPVKPVESGRTLVSVAADSPAYRLWGMTAFWLTFAGGLASAACGLGLQSERPGSGRIAMALSGGAGLFFWAYLAACIFWFPGAARIVIAAIMALAWTALFLLDGHCAELLRRHPPRSPDSTWTPADEDDLRRSASPHPPDRTSR